MRLSEFLDEKNIVPELKARDKNGVLDELAEVVSSNDPLIEKGELIKVLVERERLGTTGIGDGVAIPHGKLSCLTRPVVAFARSLQNLDFDSMDGKPAHLFFLLAAPALPYGMLLQG